MRLLCPFCQKAITVADSEAGKAVNCPECGQQFAAPQLYTPSPVTPPPMPPPVPANAPDAPVQETYISVPEFEKPAPAAPAKVREDSGDPKTFSFPLDPKIIRWIPAAALFIAFVLTFLPWNGLYPAGYPAYTQNAWQALLGWNSKDAVAEDMMKLGSELDEGVRSCLWLLPYLLLFLPTLVLALAGPAVELIKIKLPEGVERFWQFRPAALGLLAIMMLMLLAAQWVSGFGLQKAVDQAIDQKMEATKSEANTPEKMQRWEMRASQLKGSTHVKTTPWLRLAMFMHIVVAIAVIAEAGLMLRGKKPPPRVVVMW
jgi:hypothetical protein